MEPIQITDYSPESYRQFLDLKKMPMHRVDGNRVYFETMAESHDAGNIGLAAHLWDYQQFITRLAIRKRKYAIFADVGLGKTAIFLEWVRHVSKWVYPKKTLIISQLHLIKQTIEEQFKFYGWSNITDINLVFDGSIDRFMAVKNGPIEGCPVGIVNVDKFRNPYRLQDDVGAVVLDESSILKSETGKLRTNIINACKGIQYKLACTATPAPNDRQEYANHALFLGYIDNYKSFFTKFFYNTGKGNEFVMKPHAKGAFYAFLAEWSIFLKNPKQYGFADNLADLKPAQVIWEKVSLTDEQNEMALRVGQKGQLGMFGVNVGGMVNRNKLSQIAKGFCYDGNTNRKSKTGKDTGNNRISSRGAGACMDAV